MLAGVFLRFAFLKRDKTMVLLRLACTELLTGLILFVVLMSLAFGIGRDAGFGEGGATEVEPVGRVTLAITAVNVLVAQGWSC